MRCTPDTRLVLRTWNSLTGVAVRLSGLFRPDAGTPRPFAEILEPTNDRALNTRTMALSYGEIISATLSAATGAPLRGQTFCQLLATYNGEAASDVGAVLLADYLQNNLPLGWPGGPVRSSLCGEGWLRSITGTNPAAGVEISEAVPANARWQFHSMAATLVASGAAANRRATIAMDDGTNVYFRNIHGQDQTAGQTVLYTYAAMGREFTVGGSQVMSLTPMPAKLSAGHRLRTITNNLQAGDDWGAPQFEVMEWIET